MSRAKGVRARALEEEKQSKKRAMQHKNQFAVLGHAFGLGLSVGRRGPNNLAFILLAPFPFLPRAWVWRPPAVPWCGDGTEWRQQRREGRGGESRCLAPPPTFPPSIAQAVYAAAERRRLWPRSRRERNGRRRVGTVNNGCSRLKRPCCKGLLPMFVKSKKGVHLRSGGLFSVHMYKGQFFSKGTCTEVGVITFGVGVVVSFKLKRRLRQWAAKLQYDGTMLHNSSV
ncbi:unnamed protein product [Urochloa humidicola]